MSHKLFSNNLVVIHKKLNNPAYIGMYISELNVYFRIEENIIVQSTL